MRDEASVPVIFLAVLCVCATFLVWTVILYLYSGSLGSAGFSTLIFMGASFHYIIRFPNV